MNDSREKQKQKLQEANSKFRDLENQINDGEKEIVAVPNSMKTGIAKAI